MAEQVQRKSAKIVPSDGAEVTDIDADSATSGKLKAELDDLLDEIDALLEVNAEDFVRGYVQKGGE